MMTTNPSSSAWILVAIEPMDIVQFRDYCLSLGDVEEKTPFGKFAARYNSILVFYVCGHMFCMLDIDDFTSVSVKANPDDVVRLREEYSAAVKPFNLSERHWLQLNFNGDLRDGKILELVKDSYEIVKAKYSKRKRQ